MRRLHLCTEMGMQHRNAAAAVVMHTVIHPLWKQNCQKQCFPAMQSPCQWNAVYHQLAAASTADLYGWGGGNKQGKCTTTFGAIFWMEPNLAAFGCWQTLAFFSLGCFHLRLWPGSFWGMEHLPELKIAKKKFFSWFRSVMRWSP